MTLECFDSILKVCQLSIVMAALRRGRDPRAGATDGGLCLAMEVIYWIAKPLR